MKLVSLLLAVSVIYPVSGTAFSAPPDKANNVLYMSIVSTEVPGLAFIEKYKELNSKFKNLLVVNSNDCTNLKPDLLLLVSDMGSDEADIKSALNTARASVPDSYLRTCELKPDSTLANHVPYIHQSIFKLPAETISWSFDDVRSEIISLDSNYSILIERTYNGDINNEVEGRQAALILIDKKAGKKQQLLKQCWDFAQATRNANLLSFQCMTGVAANEFIHTVYVYNLQNNKIVFDQPYCQNPVLKGGASISCSREAVNESGKMALTPQVFSFK